MALVAVSAPLIAVADSQCGPFHLAMNPAHEVTRVNGIKPTNKKVSFLREKGDYDNVKMQWTVAATKFQGKYRMDYVNQQGKAALNVEIVRTSQNQIRIRGSYDCEKVE